MVYVYRLCCTISVFAVYIIYVLILNLDLSLASESS
jgi:hypothetical protein